MNEEELMSRIQAYDYNFKKCETIDDLKYATYIRCNTEENFAEVYELMRGELPSWAYADNTKYEFVWDEYNDEFKDLQRKEEYHREELKMIEKYKELADEEEQSETGGLL